MVFQRTAHSVGQAVSVSVEICSLPAGSYVWIDGRKKNMVLPRRIDGFAPLPRRFAVCTANMIIDMRLAGINDGSNLVKFR